MLNVTLKKPLVVTFHERQGDVTIKLKPGIFPVEYLERLLQSGVSIDEESIWALQEAGFPIHLGEEEGMG